MKLHYTNVLLFSLPLNILEHNKNKTYTKQRHTTTTTSRMLSECDIQSSIYDNDAEMKSVKENFDRQTSQRFDEYEERMKGKRQKRKEERDKNIQEIIEKDRMDKSLAEKVEKGCLRCGFGLGCGVLPVWGLVSGLWYATWSQYVSAKVLEEATNAAIKAGIIKAIEGLKELQGLGKLVGDKWSNIVTPETYSNPNLLSRALQRVNIAMCYSESNENVLFCNAIQRSPESVFVPASKVAADAGEAGKAVYLATEKAELLKIAPATNALTTAIIASVVSIIVIVLVMVIIYLILRYRRKKK
ncbi:hypothetical protein PFTANZ_04195 [Plasmodium falciparum Tanzania (2000708)]|uniref:Surface antigen n=1 Tax=Plasmodium falciparum Tanzania (2000708) TaxID=1036725 RepID=A0A024W2D7_PLAFA|nr:hypothetical protein PFTANZ_04195 [Plasmodium falciparum Tanzania (2000708)]